MDIAKLLKEGYTDTEIKKILRPVIQQKFNQKDFNGLKEYRRAVEHESYRRISEARREIKNANKIIVDKEIERVRKKGLVIQEPENYAYITINGRKIKCKIAG